MNILAACRYACNVYELCKSAGAEFRVVSDDKNFVWTLCVDDKLLKPLVNSLRRVISDLRGKLFDPDSSQFCGSDNQKKELDDII